MSAERPVLVLVSGAPGSGKSTLAKKIAYELRLLHFERDLLMWGLRYTYGSQLEREKVGIRVYYETLAGLLKNGVSFITDATLYRDKSEADIEEYLVPYARIINVHCKADNPHARFYSRELAGNGGKRPHWLDDHMLHLEKIFDSVDPLTITAKRIEVNTTDNYAPSLDSIISEIGNKNSVALGDPYGSKKGN